MLSSGNPVAWDIERGGRSRELIAVMHKRGHDTEHWAVRIDRASHRISHISAGPILTMRDFQPEVRRRQDASHACCSPLHSPLPSSSLFPVLRKQKTI